MSALLGTADDFSSLAASVIGVSEGCVNEDILEDQRITLSVHFASHARTRSGAEDSR